MSYIRRIWQAGMDALRHPGLHRDALFLTAATVVAALGGFVWWKLITLRFALADIGLASAAVSSATFLGSMATLSLPTALVRFLPGQSVPGRIVLIRFANLVTFAAGILAMIIFLAGGNWWAPALLSAGSLFLSLLAGLTMLLAHNNLIIAVLQAGQHTPQLLARALTQAGIQVLGALLLPVSWGASGIIITTLLTNLVLLVAFLGWTLRSVKANHTAGKTTPDTTLVEATWFSLGNQVFNLLWGLPAFLFPLLTLHQLGVEANAHLAIPWTIYGFIAIIPSSTSLAFLMDGSNRPDGVTFQSGAALKLNLVLLIPLIAAILVLAGPLLEIFGEEYRQAVILLRLLALSGLPVSLSGLYLTLLRLRKKLWALNIFALGVSGFPILLATALMTPLGLDGLGWGWLLGQSALALITTPLLLKKS